MSRPTLHLASWSRRDLHGPGLRLCAMARPRRWEHGDGLCADAAPAVQDLIEVQREWDLHRYRAACDLLFGTRGARWQLHPLPLPIDGPTGGLVYRTLTMEHPTLPVRGGDSLLCGCAPPGSKRRAHPCHLELLAPFLVLAGWDVVLWGRRVTACIDTWDGPEGGYHTAVIYDDDGQPFDATAYGWPEDPTA